MAKKQLSVTIPEEIQEQLGMKVGDEVRMTVRGNSVVMRPAAATPFLSQTSLIWPVVLAVLASIGTYIYWHIQGRRQIPLSGSYSVASFIIVLGAIEGILLFGAYFIKSRNDSANRFSKNVYWRNFPVIVLGFGLILIIALLGVFWVLGNLFDGATFDRFTATLLLLIFLLVTNAFMVEAALSISSQSLTQLFTMVIVGGVVISMASNHELHWWQHNLSFLGTVKAQNSWQFNVTLIFAALMMLALIDYLFVSLREVVSKSRKLWILRGLLTALALDLGAVGLFPNDTTWHFIHDSFAGFLVTILVLLMIGIRWLLPGVTKEFMWLTYGMGIVVLLLEAGFRWAGYPSLTAFEIQAFVLAFGWLLLLFQRIQALINEGPQTSVVRLHRSSQPIRKKAVKIEPHQQAK